MKEAHLNPETKICSRRYTPDNLNKFCLKYCNHQKRCIPKNKFWLQDEFLNWQIINAQSASLRNLKPEFKIPYPIAVIMCESLAGEKLTS